MSSVNWHEIPCVRICSPFAAGILTQQSISGIWPVISSAAIVIVLILLTSFTKVVHFRQQLRTVVLFALMFAAGAFARSAAEPNQENIKYLTSNHGNISATVCNSESTERGCNATLKIIFPTTDDIRAIAYLTGISGVLPGDTLIFAGGLQEIPAAANPYVFDVAGFYARQGIYLRAFLDTADIIALRSYNGFHLARKSAQMRDAVQRIYRAYLHDKQSFAVMQAMTLGIKDDLDDRIRDAYAKSGAIHVLSISGLHVGIVSFLLFSLVGRARPSDRRVVKILRAGVLLGGIWAFACIAGLSPSITRAALMFSIYLTGVVIRRPANGLNVLGCTAFVCLCADPLLLNSVSFQFSYLALFGIVIFFRPIYRLLPVRSSMAKFVWGTLVMSISAQIFLFPLLIYYFQQVSLISPLSSLIAIPAAYIILSGGVLILALHTIAPVVATFAGQAIDCGIGLVNTAIVKLSELPMSHIFAYLAPVEVAVLLGITILVALRVATQRKQWTWSALPAVALFGVLHIQSLAEARHEMVVAIYPHGPMAVDLISGRCGTTTFNIDSMPAFQAREAKTFRSHARLCQTPTICHIATRPTDHLQVLDILNTSKDTSFCESYRIAILTASDYALLNTDLIEMQAAWVILSANLSPAMRKAAQDFCMQHDQPFHDLREKGTFYLAKQENTITHENNWRHLPG